MKWLFPILMIILAFGKLIFEDDELAFRMYYIGSGICLCVIVCAEELKSR